MIRQEDVFRIGRVGKPHGVRGEVTVHITDDVFDRVDAEYLVLSVDGIMVPFFMEEYRFRSDESVLVTFEGIDTQDKARALTGCEVWFPRGLSDSQEDEMTWSEIVGYTVKDAAGKEIGHIQAVDDSTENILFLLEDDLLVPAPEEFILSVSHDSQTIVMQLPEGLI